MKDTSILNQWYHSGVKETIELDIISTLHEELPQQIVAILDGQITVSKRIRSLFFNILTEGQIDHQTFLNVSLGIELAHQASLIFDDIIDDSDYREWWRTSLHHKLWWTTSDIGVAQHIWEILLTLSNLSFQRLENLDIMNAVEEVKLKMAIAQLKDVGFIQKSTTDTYMSFLLDKAYDKTSVFFQLPFHISNILIDGEWFDLYLAQELGILYQIWDDMQDIKQGLQAGTLSLTYPLCFLLDNVEIMKEEDRKIFQEIFDKNILNQEDAWILTSIFKTYEQHFIEAIHQRLSVTVKQTSWMKNTKLHTLIVELLSSIFSEQYWNYKWLIS